MESIDDNQEMAAESGSTSAGSETGSPVPAEASSAPPEEVSEGNGADSAALESGELGYDEMVALYDESMRNLKEGEIVTGNVIEFTSNDVVVDVGFKSEGLIPREEFTDRTGKLTVEIGDKVDVLLEKAEDREGHVLLSKQKAERMKVWTEIETSYKEGKIITGRIIDRIKGGLTVDVGIRAFLPGSLVDIKPVKHLESLRGEDLEFKVISLDRRRNNVVLSRKAVLEREFLEKKADTLTKLKEGVVLPGVVKNITDYGVFVDLGGIDGLLHITDISWGRVNHPSEHFAVGDETEVMVLKFDPQSERVSLGFKQRSDDPWTVVDKSFPLGSRVRGKVVSLVDYGAFVELEDGIEGLVHVSEMSWTKKVVNPSKILAVGEEVEAIVSELDLAQRRISLSLRQAERNPWEDLAITHPVGTLVEGEVRNLTEFGAFVQITEEIDGLIHVSDMSWTKRIKHPSEVLAISDSVQARITSIDVDNQRVSLSIKEFLPNEWETFKDTYNVGDDITGRVVNVTDFGLFVDVYEGLEGLAHVSEIDLETDSLEDQYRVGDWVRARILRVEEDDKKVGLAMRGVEQPSDEEIEELQASVAKPEVTEDAPDADEAVKDAEEVEAVASDEVVDEAAEVVKEADEVEAAASDEAVDGAAEVVEEADEVEAAASDEVVDEAAEVVEEADEVEAAASDEAAEVVEEADEVEAAASDEANEEAEEVVEEAAMDSAEESSEEDEVSAAETEDATAEDEEVEAADAGAEDVVVEVAETAPETVEEAADSGGSEEAVVEAVAEAEPETVEEVEETVEAATEEAVAEVADEAVDAESDIEAVEVEAEAAEEESSEPAEDDAVDQAIEQVVEEVAADASEETTENHAEESADESSEASDAASDEESDKQ